MNKLHQLSLLVVLLGSVTPAMASDECVILLHGLARSSSSMEKLESVLEREGYFVANVGYPSRQHEIAKLAGLAVESGLSTCPGSATKSFVTHSLGGILVRYYLKHNQIDNLGRVVMIAPPNQGSQVVDDYKKIPGYEWVNGPAGLQLGTDESSIPVALGRVDFPLGVIAGTRSFNPILSQSLPNPDDGKVSVENTKVEGMEDFIQVPHTHTFMMRAPLVIEQTLHFLAHGAFAHTEDES